MTPLGADGDAWQGSPAAVAAGAIQQLLSQESAKLAPLLAKRGEAAMADLKGSTNPAAFRSIARLYPGTQAAIQAALNAATVEEATGMFEKAEAVLREMARSPHPPTAAAGLAALADLHQKKGWLWQARGEWELLAKQFPDAAVAFGGKTASGKALAAARLADKALAEAERDMFKGVPEPPWRVAWQTTQQPGYAYPANIRQSPYAGVLGFSQFLEQHLFFQRHGSDGRLVCRRLRDGETLYEAPLARPPNYLQFQAHEGARDGHIALLQGNNAWEGFGLVSGKTIWSRTQPVAQPGIRYGVSFAWRMNIQYRPGGGAPAGCVVMRPSANAVRVLELATGEDRWERTFRRRQVTWAQEAGRYILLALEGAECWICDSLSGERVGTFDLGDGQQIGYPRSFQVTRLGALYRRWDPGKTGNKIALLELPTGKALWSIDLGQEYRTPLVLNEELFYLQGGSKGLEVRELATGAVKFALPPEKFQGYLQNVTISPDGKKLGFWAHDGQGKMRAGTVDLATGNVVQGSEAAAGFFSGGIDLAEVWARSGDLIPWMTVETIKEGNNIRHTNLRIIGFTRKSDGKPVEGLRLPSPRPDGKFENVNQLFVQDGMLILARHDGIQVFGRDPNPPAPTPAPRAPEPPKEDKK